MILCSMLRRDILCDCHRMLTMLTFANIIDTILRIQANTCIFSADQAQFSANFILSRTITQTCTCLCLCVYVLNSALSRYKKPNVHVLLFGCVNDYSFNDWQLRDYHKSRIVIVVGHELSVQLLFDILHMLRKSASK